MTRKGSANIWWIIIGAVMAILVLFVLLFIFTDQIDDANTSLSDCKSKGGKCETIGECPAKTLPSNLLKCAEKTKECCIGLT
jgi:hypothetical protein